ncbi:MAG: DUF1992 domain-containing protein [Chloroflexota bacterium]
MGFNIEEHIQEAQKNGHFDGLAGKGKPLTLKQNPFAQSEQLSHDILQNSGFSLPWIEQKREIEADIEQAAKKLRRVWIRFDGSRQAAYNWRKAKAGYHDAIEQINRRILTFNLKAPSPQLHLHRVDAESQIAQIQRC